MKLKYYLIPMHKAAAWQVVYGRISEFSICQYILETSGYAYNYSFYNNTGRDEWIAAVHKHLAEWAYGKEEVPEAVEQAEEMLDTLYHQGCMSNTIQNRFDAWREKWMKPREPREISKYLYEV